MHSKILAVILGDALVSSLARQLPRQAFRNLGQYQFRVRNIEMFV